MWNATYKNIDKNGLRAELKVTVTYSDGTVELENTYDVLPDDLENFTAVIQDQIDILNSKDIKIPDPQALTIDLAKTPIEARDLIIE